MWAMAQNSMSLFVQGKLFRDRGMVFRQLAIGVGVTAALFLLLAEIRMPVPAAALVASLIGGVLQPYLFKDLRYR
jgi:hypothetical protein